VRLTLQGVVKRFPAHKGQPPQTVLRNVDLTVEQGEFVSLIGHSGCGKSTLLNVVAGLTCPDAGRVMTGDTVVTGPGPDRAMVFQNYSLLPRLSLFGNVREAARAAASGRARAVTDEIAERYLTAVGLWEHKDKRPGQVSGGMQQRTAVARAFAVGPRILLLDEPFGALDALTRSRLQDQLVELWQSESTTETVLMVTHGIDEAIALADRVIVMGNPPGPSIVEILDVDLPRPRDRVKVVDQPEYRRVHQRLLSLLRDEGRAAA
jgi:nitrate ABC transporter ATP-binding subunit